MTCLSVNPSVIPRESPSISMSIISSIIQRSAKFMVKIPTSIPGQNILKLQIQGKFLSIRISLDSSVSPSDSQSVTPSPSAENPSKFPGNNGEKNMVSYHHEIPVKIPTVHTLSAMSVIAPTSAMSIPSIHMSDDKHQVILEQFPILIMGRNSCLN